LTARENPVKAVIPSAALSQKTGWCHCRRAQTGGLKKPRALSRTAGRGFILESTGKIGLHLFFGLRLYFWTTTTGDNGRMIGGLSLLTIGGHVGMVLMLLQKYGTRLRKK